MAIQEVAPGWKVTYTWGDKDRNVSFTSATFPATMAYAALLANVTTLGTVQQNNSDAVLMGWSISRNYNDPTVSFQDAAASSDVERKAVTTFVDASGRKGVFTIPSILASLVTDGKNTIPHEGVFADYITAMLNIQFGAGNSPISSYGDDWIRAIGPSKKTHRGSSKG